MLVTLKQGPSLPVVATRISEFRPTLAQSECDSTITATFVLKAPTLECDECVVVMCFEMKGRRHVGPVYLLEACILQSALALIAILLMWTRLSSCCTKLDEAVLLQAHVVMVQLIFN